MWVVACRVMFACPEMQGCVGCVNNISIEQDVHLFLCPNLSLIRLHFGVDLGSVLPDYFHRGSFEQRSKLQLRRLLLADLDFACCCSECHFSVLGACFSSSLK